MIGELGREVGEAISKVCKTLLRLPVTKRTWFVRPPLGGNATDPWRGGPDHRQSRWLRPRRFGKTLNLDMLIPRKMGQLDPMVIEFKVRKPKEEASLEETVAAALQQIEDKAYDTVLAERGFEKERIRHYGFAFEGKHSAERAGT